MSTVTVCDSCSSTVVLSKSFCLHAPFIRTGALSTLDTLPAMLHFCDMNCLVTWTQVIGKSLEPTKPKEKK